MTKRQAQRYLWLCNALQNHGVKPDKVDILLRCAKTLHTWAEHECNGEIQRDEKTGKPYWYYLATKYHASKRSDPIPDRETGALKRASAIATAHGLTVYHQTDPRGCMLYLIRPGDVPEGQTVDACYTNGIAVCID